MIAFISISKNSWRNHPLSFGPVFINILSSNGTRKPGVDILTTSTTNNMEKQQWHFIWKKFI